ncbi:MULTISPECIES: S9 family peptidase [Pseudoalteromonas]|uniref:Dipeptidyl acylaminoacyl-peptidase n=1 Tax=Pseudoalteromonas luteoviolacea (strain 2ta16) TaxID=1353533 RepID=V4HKS4_PSEL2|nr:MULTISPECIES: S9 family peptidase [Pseudoalteromonas]ESP91415.1 dipeptidyl acylaminoacyl-peptidase [Pseudoalteromonas luteoviolacea 2ta16]KZN40062.1 peptidase S9 [Pseudoalteromonas luteoviolacea NCIMB 1944]MCG7551537.1 S9 family peptidase [Pseudoalteromonas sp. Of7M-16]
MLRVLLSASIGLAVSTGVSAQEVMTPEKLWQVKRVTALGLNKEKTHVIYSVTTPSVANNDFASKVYQVPVKGGKSQLLNAYQGLLVDSNISPDGSKKLFHEKVNVESVLATHRHKDLSQANAYVFDDLNYRHWDTWNDGGFKHVFYQDLVTEKKVDIMEGKPYSSPTSPFGGSSDYIWGPKGENIYYVSKKLEGTEYVTSTNTDIYRYNLASKKTTNLTQNNLGYDKSPAFSAKGHLAWLQMDKAGYEADKNDIIVRIKNKEINLTEHWDGTVNSFKWSPDGKRIYFVAPTDGTIQLFQVSVSAKSKPKIKQLTKGQYDVNGIVAALDKQLVVTRSSMNRASEIFRFDLRKKNLTPLTKVNDAFYAELDLPTVKKHMVTTKDGQEMLTWVIYPPNFDESKKYPTLLYLQGGPQSALSQFYSFRWNFQVMASQGYIVVAPNRRGMPGHGVKWNEDITQDWGGKAMQDYLDAIDDVAKAPYVDKKRIGAIGASFGGYSAFYLAGNHDGRFKTFISHCGIFDLRSMYGTTEELFFVNHEFGGPYWEQSNASISQTYNEFNPINFVDKWDAPMFVIHGGKDYRVPLGQGIQAFQAAKLRGLESRFLYFPEENHWVLTPQNGIVWQREFFKWLEDTL